MQQLINSNTPKARRQPLKQTSYTAAIILLVYFLFLLLFVSPLGNFPLNDDWSYGEGVHNFLQTGSLLMPTVCAAGFTHILLGLIPCKFFGFSYDVLRISVICLGLIGSLFFYGALRELKIKTAPATFLALLYAANPLMVNLYFSFMSDVTALSLTSIYFFVLLRAVNRNSFKLSLLSLVLFILSIGARQSAIIFLPCNIALLAVQVKNRKLLYSFILASVLLPLATYYSLDYWLIHRPGGAVDYVQVKIAHNIFLQSLLFLNFDSLYKFTVALGQTSCYLALFSAPALLAFLLNFKKIKSFLKAAYLHLSVSAFIVLLSIKELVINQTKLMPFNQNLLRIPMVCALTIMGLNLQPLSKRYMKWLTGISFFLAFVLLALTFTICQLLLAAYNKYKESKFTSVRLAQIFICCTALIISIAFCSAETVVRCTDRYYLIALGPVLLSLAYLSSQLKINLIKPLPIITLAFLAFYSACAAQDYMGWNRLRWLELENLESKGVPASQIDGGYEFNTLRDIGIYSTSYRGQPPRDQWRSWPIKGEKYILSFSTIPGYKIIDNRTYWSALSFSPLQVLLLQQEDTDKSIR